MANGVKLKVRPIDPIICRDSRPFGRGQGRRMRSLDWPTPSVVCGSLKSAIGKIKTNSNRFPKEIADELKEIVLRGPFLESRETLYFPCPLDFTTNKSILRGQTAIPVTGFAFKPGEMTEYGHTDMPFGLKPTFLENPPEENFKPEEAPAFWSAEAMCRWLANTSNFALSPSDWLRKPDHDERIHAEIDPASGRAAESFLFATTGLDFIEKFENDKINNFRSLHITLEAIASDEDYETLLSGLSKELHPLGGERRLAEWSACAGAKGWLPLYPLEAAMMTRKLRMILATPAIFEKGWLPGWLNSDLEGTIPCSKENTNPINVKLVSAIVERWQPISGFSFKDKIDQRIKPLRRMVPAGSVYFFEMEGEQNIDLGELWLESVCDNPQDRNNGFGAALWGTW